MGQATEIAWTDSTWNPVRGCSRLSPGCERCYAERVAARFSGPGMPYHGLAVMGEHGARWTRKVVMVPEHLADPLRWSKPRRIFVNSMSDLFHEELPNKEIAAVFGVMQQCTRHTFQILTKRAKRMREWFEWVRKESGADRASPDTLRVFGRSEGHLCGHAFDDVVQNEDAFIRRPSTEPDPFGVPWVWPLPNVWLGVSVEDQQRADERIPELLKVPAAVRFLSVEPQLEHIDLGFQPPCDCCEQLPKHDAVGIHWVIVGGESGPGARPFNTDWASSIVGQCRTFDVPVFVKQFGAHPIDGLTRLRLKDRKGGDLSEVPGEWPREFPVSP